MGALDLGTHGDRIHSRDLVQKQTALEPGVDSLDLGSLAEEFFIDIRRTVEDGRVGVGLPTGVVFVIAHLGAGLAEVRGHRAAQGEEGGHDRGSVGGDELETVLLGLDHGKIGRGLHQTGDVAGHGLDTVREGVEQTEQPVTGVHIEDLAGRVVVIHLFDIDAEVGIRGGEFFAEFGGAGVGDLSEAVDGALVETADGKALTRDGVVLRPTIDGDQIDIDVGVEGGLENASRELDGVSPILDDVEPRVTAGQPADGEIDRDRSQESAATGDLEKGVGVGAAGAAHIDRAVFFGVEVEENPAVDHRGVEHLRPGEAGLFVDRGEDLQRSVDHSRVIGKRHGGGEPDPVVGAKGGSHGADPVAIDLNLDALGHEVVFDIGVLLADHVEMALEHDGLGILVTLGGRDSDHHGSGFVLLQLVTLVGGPLFDVGADFFFVF